MSHTRRDFIRMAAGSAAGLMLAIELPASKSTDTFRPNAWLRVDSDGVVTIIVGKQEMGQGVRTSLPMIVADELDADWKHVRIEQASTGPDYTRLNTGGSWSLGGSWKPLRQAGASARAMLVAVAATKWKTDAQTLRTENGFVIDDEHHRRAGYGELAAAAAKLEVPKDVPLKTRDRFRLIGKRTSKVDDRAIVTGRAKFGLDTRVPGMRFATVVRPQKVGSHVASFDAAKAKAVHGVRDVVALSSGVAIVADKTWPALKAQSLVDVHWDDSAARGFDSEEYLQELLGADGSGAVSMRAIGDVRDAFTHTSNTIDAQYVYPFFAHAALEPMNCIASVRGDRCEIWAPTQAPNRVQEFVAKALSLDPKNVTVHPTLMGGGFGRRLAADYAIEAAELSRKIGEPVQIVWSRPDDMQLGHLQHASVHRMRGGLSPDGRIAAWSHVKLSCPIMSVFPAPSADEMKDLSALYRDSAWGAFDVPYDIAALDVSYVRVDTPVRYGPWRSVYSPSSTFARESFFDELAHAAGRDPLDFRLAHLGGEQRIKAGDLTLDRPRLRRVLETVREKSDWGKASAAGHGRGTACNIYDGDSCLAYVVDASVKNNSWRVDRVVCAVDAGLIVNPIGIEQQIEGGIFWALTQLESEITIKDGAVQQSNYHDFTIPRISDSPKIEIHILPSESDQPLGIGEPPVPPFAPAVCNAIFAATGVRMRRLPLKGLGPRASGLGNAE